MKRSLLAIKRSYVKLLLIEFLLITAFFILFNIDSFYRIYLMVGVLLIGFLLIKLVVGYERNRNRYTFDMCINMFIYVMMYFILIYVVGIFVGFLKSGYNLSFFGIIGNIFPILLLIVISEVVRYALSKKGEKSNLILLIICILFVMIDININIHSYDITSREDLIRIFAMVIIPSISSNILLTYSAINFGIFPGIVYRIFKDLTFLVIPIIPNLGEYIYAIFNLIIPLIILFLLIKDYKKRRKEVVAVNNKLNRIVTVVIVLLAFFVVSITSGVFKYYGLSIATDSMNPSIHRGDMVLVEKLNDDEIDDLSVGDILVYNKDDRVIVHRIYEILEVADGVAYVTKGDNNESEDSWFVTADKIIGKVKLNFKFVGYPAVLLNEFIN